MSNRLAEGRILDMEYGTITIGKFQARKRQELYISKANGEKFFEDSFALDVFDDSPRHDLRNAYNPRCACCWLGFSHTQQYHNAAI